MNYYEFLEQCIEDGIESVNSTYQKDADRLKLKGSIAGFSACKNKTQEQLEVLLCEASSVVKVSRKEGSCEYWYYRYYELQVEWVCNLVGAMLEAQGASHNFLVTSRGVLKADEILKRSLAELN